MDKVYLGDAVYATFDGYQIWLYTSDGVDVTNRIALNPDVMKSLKAYELDINKKYRNASGIPAVPGEKGEG